MTGPADHVSLRPPTEALGGQVECGIEFRREILVGDQCGEFDDCVVAPALLQANAQVVVYLAERGRLGVFEGDALVRREEIGSAPFRQTCDLFLRYAALRQRGRIDVDAEGAVVDLRNLTMTATSAPATAAMTGVRAHRKAAQKRKYPRRTRQSWSQDASEDPSLLQRAVGQTRDSASGLAETDSIGHLPARMAHQRGSVAAAAMFTRLVAI
jgi:hypothetical protein